MSFLQSIKSVDFYRKLKRDLQAELTEASIPGAALSVVAAVVMLGLIFAELNSFLTIQAESKVNLDHFETSAEDTLQIHLDKEGKPTTRHEERTKQLKHSTDEIMIVNFYAPWCHWCQRLEPVWEKSTATLAQKYPGDDRLYLAKVDCTAPASEALCIKHRIDAFPTILVFRKDDTGTSEHESYHGERSVPAITQWAEHFLAQAKNLVPKTRSVDADRDGVADSHNGVGCLISGLLHVQRAPGMIKIQAASEGHDFNWETMDVSHTINHLSFGPFLSEQAWTVLPPHIAAAVGAMDDKAFTSDQHVPTTHEHYIKVVRHEVIPPNGWNVKPVVSYGYVGHSNNIQKAGEVPTVRVNYDILPIVVQVSEKRQALYHFVTQLCAIIGGVFTVAGIVAAIMDKGVNLMTKKAELGKLG